MLFSTVSSIIAAGLLKLGYRFAENKKWLPGFLYHQASLRELKDGDIHKAEFFNSIALHKKPALKNALVVRELIAMHKDARIAQLKKLLAHEEEQIAGLQKRVASSQRILTRQRHLAKCLKIVIPSLVLLITGGLFAWIYFSNNPGKFANICVIVWVLILIAALVVDHTLLERYRTNRSMARQKRQDHIMAGERELFQRLENRQVLLRELELNPN